MSATMDDLTRRRFARAMELLKDQQRASSCPIDTNVPDSMYLYGRFKQATEGDVSDDQPSRFNVQARAKWDARAACRGLDAATAMREYMEKLETLVPSERGLTPEGKAFRTELLSALHMVPPSVSPPAASAASPSSSQAQQAAATAGGRAPAPATPSRRAHAADASAAAAAASLEALESKALEFIGKASGQHVMSLVDGEGDAGAADGSQFALANGQGAGDGHRRTRRHGRRAKQPKHGLAASAAASSEGSGPDAGAVEVVGDSAFMALAEVESGVPEVGVGEGASVIVSTADSAVIEYETGASHTDTVHTLLMHLAHRDRELITMVNRMRATVENRMLSQEEATAAGAQGSGGAAAAARGASAGQGSCGRGKVCDAETPKGFRGVLYRVVRALRCLALCVTRETLRALILIVVAGLLRILLRKYRNRWDWVRYFL